MVAALIRPHPLAARGQYELPFPEGATLAELALMAFPDTNVHRYVVAFIGDRRVPMKIWARVKPKAGAVVRLGLTCFEGGGSGGGKQILSIVAMIAITIFAPAAAAAMGFTGTAATVVAAGITLVGSLAVSALFKPPGIDAGGAPSSTNPADAPTYSISGQANQATPYGIVPRVYGRHRIYPRLAAVPFTVTEGPNQFLFMLLDCGFGPLDITELKIGDTALLDYRDVLYRVHPRWHAGDALEYYRNDTTYDTFNIVTAPAVPAVRTSALAASGLVLEFACPRGIVSFGDRGERYTHSVAFTIYLRQVGSGTWLPYRSFPAYASHAESAQGVVGNVRVAANASDDNGRPYLGDGVSVITAHLDGSPLPVAGDSIYIASQHTYPVAGAVETSPGVATITLAAPLLYDYAGTFIQSPIISTTADTCQISDATPQPVNFSVNIDVPPGQYEVQVTRTSALPTSDRVFDELVWVMLRSIHARPPIAVQTDHTLIELKIRASEQLSGALDNVNCVATSMLPVYSGSVPPAGAVHWDFLTDQLQPVFGANLAATTMARVNSIATRVNAAGKIETVPANTPRFDYDPVTLAPRGLLIEQGNTNIFLSSHDLRTQADGNPINCWSTFVDADANTVTEAIAAPDGSIGVTKLRCQTTGVAQRHVAQTATAGANTVYCCSAYLKAAEVSAVAFVAISKTPQYPTAVFNLTTGAVITTAPGGAETLAAYGTENAGGGWWRCWVAFDSKTGAAFAGVAIQLRTAAGNNYSGAVNDGFYVWGAQMEVGSAPTSLIQTTTGTVGRNTDIAVVANIAPFFNAAEGTIVAEYVIAHDRVESVFPGVATFNDGTDNNRVGIYERSVDDTAHVFSIAGGASQADISGGSYTYKTVSRAAFSYKANRFAVSLNGGAVALDNAGTVPVVNRLLLGALGGHNYLHGWLRRVTYYPFAATDAQVMAMAASSSALAPEMWVEQPTRNPAWAFVDVLTGSAALRPLPLARLNLPRLKHWADYCDANVANGVGGAPEPRVRFDHVVDYATTTYQLLQAIAAAGRATPAVDDGLHGVIIDEEQTLPVQMFTPHNSWGFNARRSYLNEPDGLRIKFIDPDNNWQEGNVIIYAAGKDADTAVTFEDLKLFGVTRYTQATRDGRYMKAQAMLRREEFEIQTDIENLICARGDLVAVSHDVLMVGGLSSRITNVAGAVITIADPFGSVPPGALGVRLRLSNGTITAPIAATGIAPDKFTLASVPTPAPAIGDLVSWGTLSQETADYIVKQIAPGDDFTATLTLAEVARGVYSADAGAIAPYVPPSAGRPAQGPGPAVVNLRVLQNNRTVGREPYCDLVLAWDAPPVGGYPNYRVGLIADTGVTVSIADTFSTRVEVATALALLNPDVVNASRQYVVIGVDAIGRQSEPATVTFSPTDPRWVPGDCESLASNAHDKTTTLTWLAPTDPLNPGNVQIQYYEVRWVPAGALVTWGTASRITELVPWNITTVTVPSRNGTYLVKALTASRVESVNAAATVIAVEDLVIQDFWSIRRFQPDWDGDFDKCVVDGSGRLVLVENPDGTFPRQGVFYSHENETFVEQLQCRISSTLVAEALNNASHMVDWVPLRLAAPLDGARRGVDWDAAIWIAADMGPIMMADWVPLASADPLAELPPLPGGAWRPLLHGEYIAADLRFAVLLESLQANVSPRISVAGVDIDFPERQEQHNDILVPATGLAFLFSRPFVFAPSVALDLQSGAVGDYIDRGAVDTDGFTVFVRNSAGAGKVGTIDVSAFGVGRIF